VTSLVILDYGSGNLRSALRAFERTGSEVVVTSDRDIALNASGLVVPGVGAFGACMKGLNAVGGDAVVRERRRLNRPTLGICVGMQIFFAHGVEHGNYDGVGIWDATVESLDAPVLPHMGWNTVAAPSNSALFRGVEKESFYFVHSYGVRQAPQGDALITWAEHGHPFIAAIEDGAFAATQFHPEKSGDAGLQLIKNWVATL
jgi:glutamine amidotransferase